MPVIPLHSLTAQALDAKFANKQRRYQSKYSASYLHQPAPPPPRLAPPPRPRNPMFETLRAAAMDLDLSGEHGLHAAASASASALARRHPVRRAMLGTVATLTVCAVAAGGCYAWAARAPGGQAALNATLAIYAQRIHDFASNQALFRTLGETLGEKVALLRSALRPAPVAEPAALAAAVPQQPTPDASAPAPSASPPASFALSDAPGPARAGPPKPAENAAPKPEADGAKPAPAQAEPPAAAVAAPVVTAQQSAGLLALVRQVDLLVRDTQAENEKLRVQVVSLIGSLHAKMTDLEQRLAATTHDLRDARDGDAQLRTEVAVLADTVQASSKVLEQRLLALAPNPSAAAAAEPGKPQAEAPPPVPAPADDGKAVAAKAATASARVVQGYHVQAASFGVAVLSDAGTAPGQAGGRLVTVGDQVPGVGRVTSITPSGTSWIVQTDGGAIQ